jgi:hypothetical protein
MKRLSIRLLTLGFLLALTGTGFTAKPGAAARPAHNTRDIYYYWYDDNDNYVDYNSVYNEEYNLEIEYQVLVDQNPTGGTLLEEGYVDAGKPHMDLPGGMLYGHF